MMAAKRPRNQDDVRRVSRVFVRELLGDTMHRLHLLRVAGGEGHAWTFERNAGAAWPVGVKLTIDLDSFGTGQQRLVVEMLVHLLIEQALLARLAVPLAGVELQAGRRRAAGGAKAAKSKRTKAAERDAKLIAEARKLLKVNPALSNADLGSRLAERADVGGGAESNRKKLGKLLPRRRRR